MNERIDHEVAGGVYDGRMWKVVERGFDVTHHWYCGYVELLQKDYYYHDAEAAEKELPALGGITYSSDVYGPLPGLPEEMKFIGFDTNHALTQDLTQRQTTVETIELAKLLNDLDGDRYD